MDLVLKAVMCREILPHIVLDNTSIECIYVDLIYFAMFD